MSLVSRISLLASRVGLEVKTKIDATHPGLARAWVCFGYVGNQIVVRSSHNVAGVTRISTGRYRVTFATAMPDTHYCWTALARSSTNSGTQRFATVRASTDQKTAQYVDVRCTTAGGAATDSSEINLTVFR
ncbi:MAG: hypothetical protein IE917_18175 [Betaproteobacteria bacterium]|nr:hypothetical protein [Betaproteobacteria bacterium]